MPDDNAVDESKAIEEITDRLKERFPDMSRDAIVEAIGFAQSSFDDAKVRDFVPVLIEKEAKKRLKGKR